MFAKLALLSVAALAAMSFAFASDEDAEATGKSIPVYKRPIESYSLDRPVAVSVSGHWGDGGNRIVLASPSSSHDFAVQICVREVSGARISRKFQNVRVPKGREVEIGCDRPAAGVLREFRAVWADIDVGHFPADITRPEDSLVLAFTRLGQAQALCSITTSRKESA